MKPSLRLWILAAFVSAGLVNSLFLIRNCRNAVISYAAVRGLSNPERRYLQKGNWYRVITSVENQIPISSVIRLVSPVPPWYLAYYFYPRLLKRASTNLKETDAVRRRFPADWVLVYAEVPSPEIKAYSPLAQGGGS